MVVVIWHRHFGTLTWAMRASMIFLWIGSLPCGSSFRSMGLSTVSCVWCGSRRTRWDCVKEGDAVACLLLKRSSSHIRLSYVCQLAAGIKAQVVRVNSFGRPGTDVREDGNQGHDAIAGFFLPHGCNRSIAALARDRNFTQLAPLDQFQRFVRGRSARECHEGCGDATMVRTPRRSA